jgi:hypothetical protein
METIHAEPTALGYSRRFFPRLKDETVTWRASLLIAVGLSALGVFVQWELQAHGVVTATAVTWSLLIPPIVFLAAYVAYHAIRVPLLLKIDDALSECMALKDQLHAYHLNSLKNSMDAAKFLWQQKARSADFMWTSLRQQWVDVTVGNIAKYYDIDRESASRLLDCPGMETHEDTDYLKCHIDKLEAILNSAITSQRQP